MLSLLVLACTADSPDDASPRGRDSGASSSPLHLDAELAAAVSDNGGYGGGILLATAPDGDRFRGARGRRVPGGDSITTADTFEVASITKSVTAATVLLLVEDGEISLDTTLADALPEWSTGLLVVDGDDLTATITIRQLLNHTSGLPDYWTDPPYESPGVNAFLAEFEADPNRFWTPEEILDLATGLRAIGSPGESWHYSDTNYVLLGLIVERIEGDALHDVFRDRIFDPVGMDDTWMSFREDLPLPDAHRYEADWDMSDKLHQSADWAGGGLISTADDLSLFITAVATESLFQEESSLAAMRTTVKTGSAGITYGLGIFSVELDDGSALWGHDGYGNSFAYVNSADDTVFTGTLNQTENDWWDMVEAGL